MMFQSYLASYFKPFIGLCLCLFASIQAHAQIAQATPWLSNPTHPPVKAQLVLTGEVNQTQKQVMGYVAVSLDEGWKTYWRTPGEGGVAPKFDWQNSTNIEDITWLWPAPNRYQLLGLEMLGYKNQVIFPIQITLKDWQKPLVLRADFTLSSCTDVCVLTDIPVALTTDAGQLNLDANAAQIRAKALAKVPREHPNITVKQLTWDKENQVLIAVMNNQTAQPWEKPDVLIDAPPSLNTDLDGVFFLRPQLKMNGNELIARIPVKAWQTDIDLDAKTLAITVIDNQILSQNQA
ncbi:MAG: protein-disulfide reductase DsbD domain-containing protein, partial [Vibrio sp.]